MTQSEVVSAPADMRREAPARLELARRLLADQRVRFLMTGAANAAMAFGVFVMFQHLFTGRWGYLWAIAATHVVTVLVGFASHRRLVFGVRGHVLRDLSKFELVHLTNVLINTVLLALAVEVLHMHVVFAQALIVLISAAYSWFGHSRFTFARLGSEPSPRPEPD